MKKVLSLLVMLCFLFPALSLPAGTAESTDQMDSPSAEAGLAEQPENIGEAPAFGQLHAIVEEAAGQYTVKFPIQNLTGETISNLSAGICFLDKNGNIAETTEVRQRARLNHGQSMVFSASAEDRDPVSAYVDYVDYTDSAGNPKTYYFPNPEPVPLTGSPEAGTEEQAREEPAVPAPETEAGRPETEPTSESAEEPESGEKPADTAEAEQAADPDAPALRLSDTVLTVVKGKTVKITPSPVNTDPKQRLKYTWETADPGVATVSGGTVRAVDGGTTVITCRAALADGTEISAEVEITVTVPVKALQLTGANRITLHKGESTKITYSIQPANATDQSLVWTSSNPGTVQVNADGTVTGVSAGTAKVTASTQDGSKKNLQVSVRVPSLACPVSYVKLDSEDGASVLLNYYGKNWKESISITKKGNAFDYIVHQNGSEITIQFVPMSPGSGTLLIHDKNDKESKASIEVQVDKSAISYNKYVLITRADRYDTTRINFTIKNNTDAAVLSCCFVYRHFDQFDRPVYYNYSTDWAMSLYYDFKDFSDSSGIPKGKTKMTQMNPFVIGDYPERVDIAVQEVLLSDGTYIRIAEKDLYWFSTKTNAYLPKEIQEQEKHSLEQSVQEKSGSFIIGYDLLFPFSETAKHYGYENCGEYIISVDEGSIAEDAGILAGDMLVSVDGVKITDDPFAVEKGKAKMADGEKVVFVLERPGTGLLETTLSRNGAVSKARPSLGDLPEGEERSILSDSRIRNLISDCPALGRSSGETQALYGSDADFSRDFPDRDEINTWRISIQSGTALFCDEKNAVKLTHMQNGTPTELIPVLKWRISLLEAVPDIMQAAESQGVSVIAEMRVNGGDYAQYADSEGVIDLTDDTVRSGVISKMKSSLGTLETINAFSALGEADTNGNGQIDEEEIFAPGGGSSTGSGSSAGTGGYSSGGWYVSSDGRFAVRPYNLRKTYRGYVITIQMREESAKNETGETDLELGAGEDTVLAMKTVDAVQDFVYKGNGKYSFRIVCDVILGTVTGITFSQEVTFTVN